MDTTKIWEFGYTDCIHESAMAAISLHKTKKGAETAMYLHKEKERKKWKKMFGDEIKQKEEGMTFETHCAWAVFERELLE
jgi:hypothetical protein